MLLWTVWLVAVPPFVPKTTIAEDFGTYADTDFIETYTGLNVLHNHFHSGEFFDLRYYLSSGSYLSNPDAQARADFYGINNDAKVIFNGTQQVAGGGTAILDGSTYLNLVQSQRFDTSPVKLETTFNPGTRTVTVRVTIVEDGFALNNQTLHVFLLQDNITVYDANRVVRAIQSQPITLSGLNNYQDFTVNFPNSPLYVSQDLWAAAAIQLNSGEIIQSVASRTQPQYQIRAAFEFGQQIIDNPNFNYISDPVWLFNTGETENFTIKLVKDDGPADWYLNFCDENGMCYPGNLALPFSLSAGEITAYHLNLFIGSDGIAHFRFVIESDNIQPYEIPFVYQTNTANDDSFLPASAPLALQNYPNPFAAKTTFRISAKSASQPVQIDIYDIKGKKVSSLATPALKAGMNEISWLSAGSDGKPLPSGIYFAGLKGSPNSMIKLLILNKR